MNQLKQQQKPELTKEALKGATKLFTKQWMCSHCGKGYEFYFSQCEFCGGIIVEVDGK